jgi:hypothetical protein
MGVKYIALWHFFRTIGFQFLEILVIPIIGEIKITRFSCFGQVLLPI